jgi:hypothetical protein
VDKLRESMGGMMIERLESNDDVEVDGAYFGGDVKPENHIDDQIDRRLAENQTGKEMGEFGIMQQTHLDGVAGRRRPGTISGWPSRTPSRCFGRSATASSIR